MQDGTRRRPRNRRLGRIELNSSLASEKALALWQQGFSSIASEVAKVKTKGAASDPRPPCICARPGGSERAGDQSRPHRKYQAHEGRRERHPTAPRVVTWRHVRLEARGVWL